MVAWKVLFKCYIISVPTSGAPQGASPDSFSPHTKLLLATGDPSGLLGLLFGLALRQMHVWLQLDGASESVPVAELSWSLGSRDGTLGHRAHRAAGV